jgi:pyruvate/2-oxoglutarate dehydrogenase complex dihydrolipoamide acyltransferase (E2) component
MKTKVNLPKWGIGLDEGTVLRWLKTVGEKVQKGEAIVEIETAQATQDVGAPATGTLVEILLSEGQTAQVNTVISVIEDEDAREVFGGSTVRHYDEPLRYAWWRQRGRFPIFVSRPISKWRPA